MCALEQCWKRNSGVLNCCSSAILSSLPHLFPTSSSWVSSRQFIADVLHVKTLMSKNKQKTFSFLFCFTYLRLQSNRRRRDISIHQIQSSLKWKKKYTKINARSSEIFLFLRKNFYQFTKTTSREQARERKRLLNPWKEIVCENFGDFSHSHLFLSAIGNNWN